MSSTDSTYAEKGWTNPFPEGHPLHGLFDRRLRGNQDLAILIDDYHARRGTGKTVASLQLAAGMDQTDEGITTSKVTMKPQLLRSAYFEQPERSALVLDEGEVGMSNRDAMTKTNRALREIMSTGRVEQKYTIINTPNIGFIDKDLRLLADVWITMLAKGRGLVHFLKRQPYANQGKGTLLTEKQGVINFKDIQRGTPLREVYNELTREKRAHIRGENGGGFIPQDEHEEQLKKAKKQTAQETRNQMLADLYEHPELDVSQRQLGEVIGVSQQQVGNIVREYRSD